MPTAELTQVLPVPLTWQGWYVLSVLVVGFTLLLMEKVRPELVMLGMLTLFMAAGVITSHAGLQGFSNTGLATVAVLFVIATGVSGTAGLDYLVGRVLGRPSTVPSALLRLMLPIVAVSSFVNDTPIVVVMLPVVTNWCRKCNLPVTKLLLPLSYAALLGGTVTLVGTSANLVVAGQHRRRYLDPASPFYDSKEQRLGLFELTLYGLPVALWGMVYIMLVAPRVLPGGNSTAEQQEPNELEDFTVGLQVQGDSPCVGKSVESAGLRGLKGLFLVCVQRKQETIHAVGPEFIIADGDVLFFTGLMDQVPSLAEDYKLLPFSHELEELFADAGWLSPRSGQRSGAATFAAVGLPTHSSCRSMDSMSEQGNAPSGPAPKPISRQASRRASNPFARAATRPVSAGPPQLVEAFVRSTAPIVGQTIKQIGFRMRFNASIVAVQRGGKNLVGIRLGEVRVEGGDRLLMDVGPQFWALGRDQTEVFEGVRKLTQHGDSEQSLLEREFMLPMEVQGALLAGKSIEQAGLRGLPDCFLVSVERDGQMMHAVGPNEVLQEHDILWFACRADSVVSVRKIAGLTPHSNQVDKLQTNALDRRLVQAVIAVHSPLAGHSNSSGMLLWTGHSPPPMSCHPPSKTEITMCVGQSIKEVRFRTRFDAAVVAVHRQGTRIRAKVGEIVMRPGDVLLLDTGSHFMKENRNGPLFALISEIEDSAPPRFDRFSIAVGVSAAAVALTAAGVLELVVALMLAAGVMIWAEVLTREQAMNAVRWDVIIMIGAAFGISEAAKCLFVQAVQSSGLASAMASALGYTSRTLGLAAAGAVGGVYLLTVLLCQFVANNAAVAIMYPVAATVADGQDVPPHVMACVLMLAASATYLSPFSYATNLLVYAAGGYRAKDFAVFGGPMQVWQAVVTIAVVVAPHRLLPVCWAVSVVVAALVLSLVPVYAHWRQRQAAPVDAKQGLSDTRTKSGLEEGLL